MAWKSFSFVENQGEITGKSFRVQTEQAINDIAEFAESAVDIGIGDAIVDAVAEAAKKATEEVRSVAVTTTPQELDLEKQNQARLNINVPSLDTVILRKGNRGRLAGKSSAEKIVLSGLKDVTDEESDALYIESNGAITLSFMTADESTYAHKVIAIKASSASSLNVLGAVWSGTPPSDWGSVGDFIVIDALFVYGKVILSTAFKE